MSNKPRILVVDDEPLIVTALSLRLRAAGYDVIAAYDGQAGLDAAMESWPTAMLLVISMPIMDGLTVLANLREHDGTKDLPVIILSANANEKTRSEALDFGACCFLDKPYEWGTVLQALEGALAQRDAGELQ